MRIERVTAVSVAYPEPNDANFERYLTFCRIDGQGGAVGWGEAIAMWPEACRATANLIHGLAELVEGRDIEELHVIRRELDQRTWWYGYRGGVSQFAISAIDIALWDLLGTARDMPLATMLGGPLETEVPTIASTHAFLPNLDDEIQRHADLVTSGTYGGVKVGFGKRGEARLGYELERDLEFVSGIRSKIGLEASLCIDRGQSLNWDYGYVTSLVEGLEEAQVTWLEEPFEPYEHENFNRLRGQTGLMIGAGEREWEVGGYHALLDSTPVDVVGCDPARCGGITGALEVIDLVEKRGKWFNAHAWSSAITTAASLALTASTERHLVFEMKPLTNPMQHELIKHPFESTDGYLEVPTGPGLGIEVVDEVVERFRFD